MRHSTVRKLMLSYLDDALSPGRRRKIEDHLAACPACRGERDLLERLWRVQDSPIAPPPAAFIWPRIVARLDRSAVEVRLTWPRRLQPVLLASLFILLFLGGIEFGTWLGSSRSSVSTAPVDADLVEYGLNYFDVLPPGALEIQILTVPQGDGES